MENLPTDITKDILTRLPIEFILQCKRVCRTWRDLLIGYKTGWLFAHVSEGGNIQLFYGDQDEVTFDTCCSSKTLAKFDHVKKYSWHDYYMVGSCNGLVCTDSVICNPATGEFLCGSYGKPIFEGSLGVGFGYLPSTNEYKVIRMRISITPWHGYVEVYTLGSQSGWRRKENVSYDYYMRGIFVNGAIHWMANIDQVGRRQQYKVVAFDLADEKLKHVPTPPLYNSWLNCLAQLILLRGDLCLIHQRSGDKILDIWAFKKNIRVSQPTVKDGDYYGNNWNWIKEFSIAISLPEMSYMPLAVTESNEVLLSQLKQLCCYNANTSTITKSWNGGISKGFPCLRVIPHMNTFVSLKDLGECSGNYGDITHETS